MATLRSLWHNRGILSSTSRAQEVLDVTLAAFPPWRAIRTAVSGSGLDAEDGENAPGHTAKEHADDELYYAAEHETGVIPGLTGGCQGSRSGSPDAAQAERKDAHSASASRRNANFFFISSVLLMFHFSSSLLCSCYPHPPAGVGIEKNQIKCGFILPRFSAVHNTVPCRGRSQSIK